GAGGAGPDRSVVCRHEGPDVVARQTFRFPIRLEDAPPKTEDAAPPGSDPQISGGVLRNRAHRVGGESLLGRVHIEPFAGPERQSAVGSNPEVAVPILGETANEVVGESLLSPQRGKESAGETHQPALPRPNPERSGSILQKRGDVVVGKAGSVAAVEDDETDAVEAGKTLFGSQPEVTVASL